MNIEKLKNKGIFLINQSELESGFKNIVIVGAARGGTSMVAGALHHLGIFTGEKSSPPVFEDVLLSDAFESGKLSLVREIASKYDREHDIWAWKRPSSLNYLQQVKDVFPKAFYVFIFKDIFSIAYRNNISMQLDIYQGLKRALDDYGRIIDFVSQLESPALLLSADKTLQYKEELVDTLIDSLKRSVNCSKYRQAAIEFITPNPVDYLDKSRITKCIGQVGGISNNKIIGWAKHLNSNSDVDVELYLGDELYKTCKAIQFRPTLKEQGIHPTGNCGFSFDIDQNMLSTSKEIKIYGKGDIEPLKNGIVDLSNFK